MKSGEDGMMIPAKCLVYSSGTRKLNPDQRDIHDCTLRASVTRGLMSIDVPNSDINIEIRIEDAMSVLQATQGRFLDLKKKE